jgi:hypothetical protein
MKAYTVFKMCVFCLHNGIMMRLRDFKDLEIHWVWGGTFSDKASLTMIPNIYHIFSFSGGGVQVNDIFLASISEL